MARRQDLRRGCGTPRRNLRWQDYSPFVVVEVVSDEKSEKDLVRNVELYLQVSSIREYWIIDGRDNPDHPVMLVYRRRGQRWQNVIRVEAGETYETRLLPDFWLLLYLIGRLRCLATQALLRLQYASGGQLVFHTLKSGQHGFERFCARLQARNQL